MGTRLFNREPRRISLTAAGDLFYAETCMIPKRLASAGDSAKRLATGQTTRLRIGFVSAVMNEELLTVLRRFRTDHPEVQINLKDHSPNEQMQEISEGKLDGGFVGIEAPNKRAGIQVVPWYREDLRCFVPADHPLAARRQVAMKDLAGEAFVVVSHEAAPAFNNLVRRLCGDAGFRPRVTLESPRAQAVAVMVAAGSGIAILPTALEKFAGNGVKALLIKKAPKITHVFARPAGRPTGALVDLLAILKKGSSAR